MLLGRWRSEVPSGLQIISNRWPFPAQHFLNSTGLAGCNVYISEGRNLAVLQKLKASLGRELSFQKLLPSVLPPDKRPLLQEVAQAQQRAACLQSFSDEPYNRTSFTLAARLPGQVSSTRN